MIKQAYGQLNLANTELMFGILQALNILAVSLNGSAFRYLNSYVAFLEHPKCQVKIEKESEKPDTKLKRYSSGNGKY